MKNDLEHSQGLDGGELGFSSVAAAGFDQVRQGVIAEGGRNAHGLRVVLEKDTTYEEDVHCPRIAVGGGISLVTPPSNLAVLHITAAACRNRYFKVFEAVVGSTDSTLILEHRSDRGEVCSGALTKERAVALLIVVAVLG